MGLADRDFMRERREPEQPFSPPQPSAPALRTTLLHILQWGCVAALCFEGVRWWQAQHAPPPAKQVKTVQEREPSTSLDGPSQLVPQGRRTAPGVPLAAPSTPLGQERATINRCVIQGHTTLTDGPCAPGAMRSSVTIAAPNIADCPRLPSPAPMSQAGPSVPPVIAAPQVPPAVVVAQPDMQSLCAYHAAEIRMIDQQARQALPASEQDRLAAERKFHRDEEFRLRC